MAENSFPECFEMWLKSSFSEAQILESQLFFIEKKKRKKKKEQILNFSFVPMCFTHGIILTTGL